MLTKWRQSRAKSQPSPEVKPTGKEEKKDSMKSLAKTAGLGERLKRLLGRYEGDDQAFWDELENALIEADFGVDLAMELVKSGQRACRLSRSRDAYLPALRQIILDRFNRIDRPSLSTAEPVQLYLMVGVNGVGKTTTLGKLAHYHANQGQSVILAAADTFRAAAIEQLQRWGEQSQVQVIAQQPGADSAAVVFDACQSALAHGTSVVLADTAGRLHNKTQLMDELAKIRRVIAGKLEGKVAIRTLMVVDATLGQNSCQQAVEFDRHLDLDGFVLTKMDGTAKGGMALALVEKLQKPVLWMGIGEGLEDICLFDPEYYVDRVLSLSAS